MIYSEAERSAARILRGDGDPGRRDAGRQGLAALRPPVVPRRDRRDRDLRREPGRRRRRRRDRHRHAIQRLHDGFDDGVPGSDGVRFVNINVADFDAAKQNGVRVVADARAALDQLREALDGLVGERRLPRRGGTPQRASGTRRCRGCTRSGTSRCPPRAKCSAPSTRRRRPATWSSARRARCPATCTSCGGRAIRRATTSSTATRAWATRSPAASASRWPRRSARCTCSSATART